MKIKLLDGKGLDYLWDKIKDLVNRSIPKKLSELENDMNLKPGVTSFNGKKGDVNYTPPVLSVNSKVGNVVIDVPVKTSQLDNDSGFLTEHQSLSGYATEAWVTSQEYITGDDYYTKSEVDTALDNKADNADIPDLTGYATQSWVTSQGYVSSGDLPSLDGYATEDWVSSQGFLTSFTETDPTVPAWAKANTKPTYTAQEVGALPSSTVIPTKVSQLTNDSGFTTNTGTITGITMNGASKGTSGVVNLGTVLTEHQDISGKVDKSDAIGNLFLSLDSTNYKVTLSGTKVDGTMFTVSDVIDLPLESVVVGGSYNDTTKKVVLTLQSGSTVEFSVADLVAGLQSEITSTNKLSADLIADGNTNKTVTQTEKTTWNSKGTYSKPSGGIPKTDLASAVQTSLGLADTALQSFTETDPVFSASDAAGITSSDIASWNAKVSNVQSDWNATSGAAQILNKPTIPDDSTLVHTSGDEVIQGNKWFANLKTTNGGSVSIMGTMTIDDIGGNGKIVLTGDDYTWSQIQSGNTTLQQALDAKANTASLATVATSGSYNDLSNKPTIPTVPTNISAFTNDAGYLTSHQSLSGYATETWVGQQGYLTQHQDISSKLDTTATAKKAAAIPWGQLDSTSTATVMTATVPGITVLEDGVAVMLKNGVVTSGTNFTLNINNLGAKNVYTNLAAATKESSKFNINYTMLFVYDSTRVSGGGWVLYNGYDSNTNTIGYQLRTNNTAKPMANGCRYYKILFTSADGTKWVPSSATKTNDAAAAKAVNQTPIDPFGPIVYCANNTNYNDGTSVAASAIWQQYNVTIGHAFNWTGAALTLTSGSPVYVKCAPQNDGSAIMDSTTPLVQTLPSTEDGKIYIFLGVASAAATVELWMTHPVYYYKDSAIRLWTNQVAGSGGSITIDSTPTSGSSNAVSSGGVYTALAGKENTSNKVTSLSSSSTDTQYPSAKCVYDIVGDIQTALETILGNSDDPTPSSYTFTINGTSYQSEAGMNWAQWINSAYNTDYFYLYNNVVESAAGDSICDHYGDLVYGNDLIVNGEAYSD